MPHYIIPVFVPELACPNRCVFCNQQNISGTLCHPTAEEVTGIIRRNLSTIPPGNHVEVAFFGGNFTGIERGLQEAYLDLVQPFIREGRTQSIRVSTRPDYIDVQALELLQRYRVKCIELGAQSLDGEVLKLSGRGHSADDVRRASDLVRQHGFTLGLQMMTGLPGDTPEKSIYTAKEIVKLGAENTRIYPTLVIRDTMLEKMYLSGRYDPLSLEDAVSRSADLVPLFLEAGVKILRIGLHPAEGFMDSSSLVAGPFHVAFGEMVYSEVWRRIFSSRTFSPEGGPVLRIAVPRGMRNAAIGHRAVNKAMLLNHFGKVTFEEDDSLKGLEFHAYTD